MFLESLNEKINNSMHSYQNCGLTKSRAMEQHKHIRKFNSMGKKICLDNVDTQNSKQTLNEKKNMVKSQSKKQNYIYAKDNFKTF